MLLLVSLCMYVCFLIAWLLNGFSWNLKLKFDDTFQLWLKPCNSESSSLQRLTHLSVCILSISHWIFEYRVFQALIIRGTFKAFYALHTFSITCVGFETVEQLKENVSQFTHIVCVYTYITFLIEYHTHEKTINNNLTFIMS